MPSAKIQMGKWSVLVLVAIAVALAEGVNQYRSRDEFRQIWNYTDFPDPQSPNEEERLRCHRHSISSVCNPNNIISKTDADAIDNEITKIYKETQCSCHECYKNKHGYAIRVALINEFEKFRKNAPLSKKELLWEAKMFTYLLSQKWRMQGSCNETVLIFYSKNDNVLFTLTREIAGKKLFDRDIARISMAVRSYFVNSDDTRSIGDGLLELIRRYRLIFDGKYQEAFKSVSGTKP